MKIELNDNAAFAVFWLGLVIVGVALGLIVGR